MRTKKVASPVNLWIRVVVGLGLLALICIQCTRPSDVVDESSLVRPAFAARAEALEKPEPAKLVELAKNDPVELLKLCLANYDENVQDYTCRFVKRERLGRRLGKAQEIDVKFMDDPFSVAMRWRKNAPISDRCLYVEGKYDGNLLIKPKGLLSVIGTVRRKPDSKQVMENTLKPITLFGFRRNLESFIEVYERAEKRDELNASYGGVAFIGGRETIILKRTLPKKEDYPAKTSRIYIDVERLVPVCYESWDWNDKLIGRYIYKDVKFNVGLTPEDFEPERHGL